MKRYMVLFLLIFCCSIALADEVIVKNYFAQGGKMVSENGILSGWWMFLGPHTLAPGTKMASENQRMTVYVVGDLWTPKQITYIVYAPSRAITMSDLTVWERLIKDGGGIAVILTAWQEMSTTQTAPAARPAGKTPATWGRIKEAR